MSDEPGSLADNVRLTFEERLVVLLGGILAALVLTGLNPVLPEIQTALARGGMDQMLVKQLVGGASIAMVIGAPLGGFLVSGIGRPRMLLIASIIYVIAGTSGLYISSLPLLVASRVVLGVVAAMIQVTSLTIVNTRLQGAQRAKWMGLHVSMGMFSTLVILPLSGVLGAISWRLPFCEYILGLVLVVAVLAGGKRSVPDVAPIHAPVVARIGRASLFNWFPWHYIALSLLVGCLSLLPSIYIPFLLHQKAGLSAVGISAVLTGTAFMGAWAAFFYGRARSRLSVHAAMAVSFGLASIGALIAALAAGLPGLVAGLFLFSLGGAWFVPNMMTAIGSRVDSRYQARATGVIKAFHFGSGPLCILLIDPYARRFGPAVVLDATSFLAFCAFVTALLRMAGHLNLRSMPRLVS